MAVIQAVSRYRWLILGVSLVCQISAALASQILAPLAPLFQPELGLSKTEVGLLSAAPFAGAWCVLLVAGSFTDRFGMRRMLSLGQFLAGALLLSMFRVGSALEAGIVMFAVGIARGTVFPGSTKAIMVWFPPASRATAMGLKQTGAPMGGILAAATLPTIALAMGWRVALAVVGFFVVGGGLVAALLYHDPASLAGSGSPRASMRDGLKVVLANPGLWTIALISALYVTAQQGLLTYLALYLKEVVLVPQIPDDRGRIVAAGTYLALCQFGGVLGRIFWGMASDRFFHGRRLLTLAVVGATSTISLAAVGQLQSGSPLWLVSTITLAAGMTSVAWNGVYHAALTETAGRTYAATGVGFGMTLVELGTSLGPPLFGLVVDLSGSYSAAWLFVAGLATVGTLVAAVAARGEHAREVK